jgi:hypothetical protein
VPIHFDFPFSDLEYCASLVKKTPGFLKVM